MTRLTELALRQPAITFLVTLAVLVGGIWAAMDLNQELVPAVEFPQATVLTVWPGASADQVTREVVQPIEDALEGIADVDVVEVSANASDSFAAVTVRAEYGTTQAELSDAIQKQLDTVDLPDGVEEPEIVLFSFSDLPVVQASIRAGSEDIDPVELRRLIEDEIVPEIESAEGVSQVTLAGGQDEKITLTLDRDKMAAAGVTAESIRSMLAANNISFPVGDLKADGRSIPLQVSHRIQTESDLAALVLTGGGSAPGGPGGPGAVAGGPAGAGRPGGPPAAGGTSGGQSTAGAATSPGTAGQAPGTAGQPSGVAASGAPTSTGTITGTLAQSGALDASGRASAGGPRVQVVVVSDGDTLIGLSERYGVSPELIRQANGLEGDLLLAGSVLRIPVAADDEALPDLWRVLGAERAGEITPELLARALAEMPTAVSGLTAAQLLALPPATVRQLPLPLVSRQPDAVRQALINRMGILPTATPGPTPQAARAPSGARLLSPERQAEAGDGVVTLGDVAVITREAEGAKAINRTDGQTSLSLLVFKEQGANTVTAVEDVLARVETLKADDKLDGIEWNIIFEQATFIEESLSGVVNEGLLGSLLAILVILIFLNFSVRATLIIAVSIPLSILSALLLMRFQGLTLNLLTLAGLTIAIGRVVDDAIVVIENIYRHIQRGDEDRLTSVIKGTREVATAITAATLVTVAVFLPLGFVGGITSEFFLPFALTTTYALLASLIVAVTVVPLLASRLLKRESMPESSETWLQRVYTPVLTWGLDHRLVTLLLATAFFVASLALVGLIDRTFLPSFGEPAIQVEMALPPGTALATTDAVARQVEERLMEQAEIGSVETTVGRGGAAFGQFSGGDGARAYFFANMDEDGGDGAEDEGVLDRWLKKGPDADAVAETLRDDLGAIGDAAVKAGLIAAGTPVTFTVTAGAAGGPQGNLYDLQVKSDDDAKLREANALIVAALADPSNWEDQGYDEIPIINLESNLTEARDVIGVEVDPAAAILKGLTAVQVALALRGTMEGQELGKVELIGPEGAETLAVVARYPTEGMDSVAALQDFAVEGPAGAVPLGEIATIRERPGPVQITRVNGRRAALIKGEITSEDTFGVSDAAAAIIADLDLEQALGEDVVEVGAGVESRQQREGFRDMLIALPISIIVVYMIMVVTFGSLLHPFTILFSLPFALSGALVGLALTGRPISISSLIGMMMLIGIVTTNAIVLVDLVQQYRARGMDARDALIRAGRTRVRPIIMTAVATVIALVPLAIGLTEGALIASELATTVIGGLITSTLLTLIVVPVIYSLLDGLSSRGREPVAAPPDGGGPAGWEGTADLVEDPAAVGAGAVAAEAGGGAAGGVAGTAATASAASAARSDTSTSIKLPETDAVALTLGETTGTPVPPPGVPRLLDTGEVPVVSG